MEQKQLDDLDQFQGEEFIDDSDFDVKVEPVRQKTVKKPIRITAKKAEPKVEARPPKAAAARAEKKAEKIEKKMDNPEEKKMVEEFMLEQQFQQPVQVAPALTQEAGLFREASTWKFITALILVLLIFSVLTQGFRFSGKEAALSLGEAEAEAIEFVNTNLLEPPFYATVASSQEVGNLYQITLSIAGQSVDSYMTKDGKLFFPQGFDTTRTLAEQLQLEEAGVTGADVVDMESTSDDNNVESTSADFSDSDDDTNSDAPTDVLGENVAPDQEGSAFEDSTENPAAGTQGESPTRKEFTLTAKKWFFWPNTITVSGGDTIVLTIAPEGLEFNFSIPALGIHQHVASQTKVEFTPDKVGVFEYTCSSCEDWRGMKGTLIVQ